MQSAVGDGQGRASTERSRLSGSLDMSYIVDIYIYEYELQGDCDDPHCRPLDDHHATVQEAYAATL